MKKGFILGLAFFALAATANAQEDTLENRFVLDFVIPDMPAFKSLGIENSDLLRPSDVRDFAVMLSPFFQDGKGVIPKNFGLEFAPWKMASKKWTLSEYNNKPGKRFLYHSSFSIGAATDSSRFSSKLAVGYRFAILSDKADLIRIAFDKNADFDQKATDARLLKTEFENYWLDNVVDPAPVGAVARIKYRDEHKKEFIAFLASINEKDKTLPD